MARMFDADQIDALAHEILARFRELHTTQEYREEFELIRKKLAEFVLPDRSRDPIVTPE